MPISPELTYMIPKDGTYGQCIRPQKTSKEVSIQPQSKNLYPRWILAASIWFLLHPQIILHHSIYSVPLQTFWKEIEKAYRDGFGINYRRQCGPIHSKIDLKTSESKREYMNSFFCRIAFKERWREAFYLL